MTEPKRDNPALAITCALIAVGLASTQDAITKSMSGSYSAYETVMFRCIGSLPILLVMLWRTGGFAQLRTPQLGSVILRGALLCLGYFCFVLAIAAMPIADAVAIYFTMPFFVAGLAGPLLGERVRPHRWLAIAAAFIGMLIMVRPGAGVFEPASLFALLSALSYAVGQMLGRPIAQTVSLPAIAMWQNVIYFAAAALMALIFNMIEMPAFTHKSLVFLSRPWVWPDLRDMAIFLGNGVLAAFAMVFFASAYKHAESSFVAPFEYSGMIWAVTYGYFVFGDFPGTATWTGGAIVIITGILMILRDRQLDRAI